MTKPCTPCPKCESERYRGPSGKMVCRTCANHYAREAYARSPETIRKRKRESMRKTRSDPAKREAANARRRESRDAAAEHQARQALRERHFFRYRAMVWNSRWGRGTVTPEELAFLWLRQRGRCALTGDKLGRDAVLDHRLAKSRGGLHRVENLQWVTAQANTAKNDMLSEDFVEFCARVLETAATSDPAVGEWIASRLKAALHRELAA